MTPGVCKRCRGPIPKKAKRCARCGAQVFVPQPVDPLAAARFERERLVRRYNLSKIQTRILIAAYGGREIFLYGDNPAEGEVKAGDHRFEGNVAVAAVAGLAGLKLVAPEGEDCFRLTDEGAQLVVALERDPAVEA